MADVPVEVLVGGKQAEILFRGRSSCCAGVDHIRFRVPEGTSGCCASLTVRIAGSESNRTSIAIAGSDGACSGDLLPEQLRYFRAQGQWRFGGVGISRQISYRQNDTTGTGTAVAAGNFYLYDARFAYRYACIPAAPSQAVNGWEEKKMGPCTVTRFRFSASFSTPTLPPPSAPAPAPTPGPTSPPMRSLDAGAALSMTGGPGGPVQLPRTTIPGQDSMFAYGAADRFTPPEPAPGSLAERLLAPGRRTLSGPGGADIGSFSEEIEIPPRLVWTNVAEINSIRRGEPLRLTWTGGSPEVPLAVAGTSAQFEITAISFAMDQAYFQCLVDNSPGAFTVPAEVVAELPAGSSPGSLGVVSWRSREMRVPDLDFSAISYSDSTMKTLSIVQP
jgi:hypothetical protein